MLSRYIDNTITKETSDSDEKFILPIGRLAYPYIDLDYPTSVRYFSGALVLQSCNRGPELTYERIGCICMREDGEIPGTDGMKYPVELFASIHQDELDVIRLV
jgi:hypothetical protein